MAASAPLLEAVPPFRPATSGWRWGLYLALIAIAGGQGLAQIHSATVKFSPARWPETRPAHTPLFSANDRSRWCTVWSLAERGTFQIDEIIRRPGWDTIDKVHVNGHFYSSKPPFVAVVTAGVYVGVRRCLGLDLDRHPHEAVHAVLIVMNLIPWVLALLVLAGLIERQGQSDLACLFTMLTAALGTFLTPFLITLNNHNPAAVCLVLSLAPVLRLWEGDRAGWRFAAAGFFAAGCACCELPAAAWGLIAFAVACRSDWRRTLWLFAPAALIPLGCFLYTNWLATGSIVPTYAAFSSKENNPYRYIVDGVPSYWLDPSPIDRGESSAGTYLFHCVLGHHGMFSLSPVFLLSLAAWGHLPWLRERTVRFVVAVGGLLTAWVLAFYLLRTESYNYGGVTSGLRWAFWLIPFWVLSLLPVLDRWGRSRLLVGGAAVLLGVSLYSVTLPRDNPWQLPWLYTLWQEWLPPKVEPKAAPKATLRSWLVSTPTIAEPGRELVARYSAVAIGGGVSEFTLRFRRAAEASGTICRVEGTAAALPGQTAGERTALLVDLTEFNPRRDPCEQPSIRGAGRAAADGSEKLAADSAEGLFLRGLPGAVKYQMEPKPKYLKTALRREAFKCQLWAGSVLHTPIGTRTPLRYRRLVWWCAELPWGVVQIEDTIADPVDNGVIARQKWRLAELPELEEMR